MRTKEAGYRSMAAVLAVWGMLFLGMAGGAAASPKGVLKSTVHWIIPADWLDPATCGYSLSSTLALHLLHDALLKPMPEGTYTPCLAESWTISPDAKVYEFKLRPGVKFHNGDIMTAEDVAFSFWRYKATYAKLIHDKTEKVEVASPYTVRFRFKTPFPDFLDYLLPGATTIAWVVPKKYVEKVGDAGFKKNPVGVGPYKFVEFMPGVKLVGEAFEDYWRKVPNIKRIEYYNVLEGSTRFAMAKRGEVDIGTLMQGVFYEAIRKEPAFRMYTPLSASRYLLYLTSQWDPKSPWSDPRVRKAASLALDRKTIIDIHIPGADPIGSIGLEGDPSAIHYPGDPYDPKRAKELLAEAGYPNGFHGGAFYPFDSGYWAMGESIATNWKAVGITVEIVQLERAAYYAMRDARKLKGGVALDPIMAPTIGARLQYLLGPSAYGTYPDIQALWSQYQQAVEPKVRKDLITGIQKMIYDRTLWIPFSSNTSPTAVSLKVKGNPFKVQPPKSFPTYWVAPFEEVELGN